MYRLFITTPMHNSRYQTGYTTALIKTVNLHHLITTTTTKTTTTTTTTTQTTMNRKLFQKKKKPIKNNNKMMMNFSRKIFQISNSIYLMLKVYLNFFFQVSFISVQKFAKKVLKISFYWSQ